MSTGCGSSASSVEALVHPAEALEVVARLLGRRAAGDAVLGHAEVDARAERAALGAHDHDADRVVEAQALGVRGDLARRLPAPRVQLLGVVQHDPRERRLAHELDQGGAVGHGSSPACDSGGRPMPNRRARRIFRLACPGGRPYDGHAHFRGAAMRVVGTVVEEESGRPLEGLVVRAYDKDILFDDKPRLRAHEREAASSRSRTPRPSSAISTRPSPIST